MVEAASTARISGVPAGKTSTISAPGTGRGRPSWSAVSLWPPSPRKAASMLTRRIVDQILPGKVSPKRVQTTSTSGSTLALGLICACLAAEVFALRVGIDDLDEGYFVQQAVRVLHGQVPYRDFDTLYSPGLAYAHAGLFWLLG